MAEVLITSQVCTTVRELASTTKPALLLTGNQATHTVPAGFLRQTQPDLLYTLEPLLTMNGISNLTTEVSLVPILNTLAQIPLDLSCSKPAQNQVFDQVLSRF